MFGIPFMAILSVIKNIVNRPCVLSAILSFCVGGQGSNSDTEFLNLSHYQALRGQAFGTAVGRGAIRAAGDDGA
jgi:hypothetical protein